MLSKRKNVINWILGNVFLNLGIVLSTKSDFGLSMIGAIPYILHVFLRDFLPWFTQGTAEYVVEAVVLVIGCIIIKRFQWKYLLTIVEGVVAGFIIDAWFLVFGGNGAYASLELRILSFALGLICSALGVAFFFRTMLPVETYDFVVMSIASVYSLEQPKVKQKNDFIYLGVALLMSFLLTGKLTGIGIGTIIISIVNSYVIAFWLKIIDKIEKFQK